MLFQQLNLLFVPLVILVLKYLFPYCGNSIPVPAGMILPMIIFSFNPSRWIFLAADRASIRRRVVSWNDAADRSCLFLMTLATNRAGRAGVRSALPFMIARGSSAFCKSAISSNVLEGFQLNLDPLRELVTFDGITSNVFIADFYAYGILFVLHVIVVFSW